MEMNKAEHTTNIIKELGELSNMKNNFLNNNLIATHEGLGRDVVNFFSISDELKETIILEMEVREYLLNKQLKDL